MELKAYQSAALDAFARWRDALEEAERASREAIAALEKVGALVPDIMRHYPEAAWNALERPRGIGGPPGPYVMRTDDAGRPIPHVCLKVPTGGGKTLLAACALERLGRQTGLTLWITPTRAIYEQTRATLRDRQHPYRQTLERASGGRVKLMEKDDPFAAADAAHYLCVMLLMLPAANRRKGRDFLRMFRDSGRYPTFFPAVDDAPRNDRLLKAFPDLERLHEGGPVKHSLFNVFKMLRPVVVLDEAHKAYGGKPEAGAEFARSVSRLDPRMIVELSATPNRGISNLLVDIGGVELRAEEMIKLPVHIETFQRARWTDALTRAHDELERLDAEARALQAEDGRYIRPIAVVRVERTGKAQRDGERVHAEDVREYLVRNLGVSERAVAVKSAERDELAGHDLLSELCPVRWVVTRAALTEGWDCPFAYVLTMLDNTTARRALTQLVGRVMRQPHARRTGREALDRCYVVCWNTGVGEAVKLVKDGLEAEGLTGLGGEVVEGGGGLRRVTVARRERFRGDDIFLPLVLHRHERGWRELDYWRHIVPEIDWAGLAAPDPRDSQVQKALMQSAVVDIGDALPVFGEDRGIEIDRTVRLSWFARRLSEIVPNAWQAARIAGELLESLRAAGESDDAIHGRRSFLAHELRKHVGAAMEKQAERVFAGKLEKKEIRFDLSAGRANFRFAESYEIAVPEDSGLLAREDGKPSQLSLFEPVYTHQFDSALERNFALYLDEQKALRWWHRIAARQGGDYYLRGWQPERIWPDFVALRGGGPDSQRLLVFETKGAHLDNPDTGYKERVLAALQGAFNCGTMTVRDGPAKGAFRLLFDKAEFPAALTEPEEARAEPAKAPPGTKPNPS